MKIEKNKLYVGFHEWASSIRTTGFPIYALDSNGNMTKIGYTHKGATEYIIPENTIAIIREYKSNKGYLTVYVHMIDGRTIEVSEYNDFKDIKKLPDIVQNAIKEKFSLPIP